MGCQLFFRASRSITHTLVWSLGGVTSAYTQPLTSFLDQCRQIVPLLEMFWMLSMLAMMVWWLHQATAPFFFFFFFFLDPVHRLHRDSGTGPPNAAGRNGFGTWGHIWRIALWMNESNPA